MSRAVIEPGGERPEGGKSPTFKGNIGSGGAEWERGAKIGNFSNESVQDRTIVTVGDKFRLVPKSSTLDYLERPIRTLAQKDASFGANCKNSNEDRPTLSATNI